MRKLKRLRYSSAAGVICPKDARFCAVTDREDWSRGTMMVGGGGYLRKQNFQLVRHLPKDHAQTIDGAKQGR